LDGVHFAIPRIADVLKEEFDAYDVLVTSLRGNVKHVHFHVVPLTHATENEWRRKAHWVKGHLHEFLGYHERESFIRYQCEREKQGWTEEEQRVEHSKNLQLQAMRLRAIIGG
jgi:diadenosine tetraphosphate (Ap4A) HIT family hydrolase